MYIMCSEVAVRLLIKSVRFLETISQDVKNWKLLPAQQNEVPFLHFYISSVILWNNMNNYNLINN